VSVPFPTFAIGVPGEARILVLERRGRIITIDPTTGVLPTPYLDLQDRVDSSSVENGLLGLAFHPDYSINGRFFVFYTGEDAEARISEFTANPPASATVDPATEQVLLTVEAGFNNRGGMLQFGSDGYLYVGVGDGGAPEEAGEPATLRGTLLRIDVDGGDPYAIPAGNPFGGASGQREVWAIGLRNPWRFSIDGDRLYVGDVGADSWEEINVQPLAAAGVDYGWPLFEGFECQDGEGCDQAGPTDPVLAYSHEEGCAVTAGYVYRGSLLPELEGHFFYADWCNGWIRSFLFEDGEVTEEQDWTEDLADAGQVASFGLDSNGELLVIDSNGNVSRIVAIR
jgi:glucose/arabinose dehydrogenase